MITLLVRDSVWRAHTDALEAGLVAARVTESSSRIALREADDLATRAKRRMQALRAAAGSR